jgi:phosphoribosyl 1,2-cyclic phosphodiesterase
MKVTSLASGSSGNALLVEAGPQGRTKLLLDAGLPGHVLFTRLLQAGVQPRQLQAVLITHEHGDHIIGLPALMKYRRTQESTLSLLTIVTAPETFEAIEQSAVSSPTQEIWDTGQAASKPRAFSDKSALEPDIRGVNYMSVAERPFGSSQLSSIRAEQNGKAEYDLDAGLRLTKKQPYHYIPLHVGSRKTIGDIDVVSFPVSHDAAAPCGYLLSAGGCRVCVVTDSGVVTPAMLEVMQHADLLILESNHDRERLVRGPYPHHLKQRILSPTGHLSNDQAAEAVLQTWRTDGVRWLWLSHLSRTNNTPKLALHSMQSRLKAARANLAQIHISVLPPDLSDVWDSTQLWQTPSLWDMPL